MELPTLPELPQDEDIIFLDIETTDFDPSTSHLLEIGAIVVTPELEELDSFHAALPYVRTGNEDPKVLAMHEKNGLWADCERLRNRGPKWKIVQSGTSVFWDEDGPQFLRRWFSSHAGAWLAGRAVKSFDQAFLEAKYPGCTAGLSHRSVDIRTLIRLERFVPRLWDGLIVTPGDAHRAMDDARGDLETLRAMVTRLRLLRERWAP